MVDPREEYLTITGKGPRASMNWVTYYTTKDGGGIEPQPWPEKK